MRWGGREKEERKERAREGRKKKREGCTWISVGLFGAKKESMHRLIFN